MSTAALMQIQASISQPLRNSSHPGLLLQRKCACGSPTTSLPGECEECASKKRLQTKLAIGPSNDPLEQEADRVADQVIAAPAHSPVRGALPRIRRYTAQTSAAVGMAPASVDRVLASPGAPLEPALRYDMEHRLGYDFSRVRVHTGGTAEQSARDVSANAYTAGHDIVFGADRFAPTSTEGRRLIAHELTHVVQQSGGSYVPLQRETDFLADDSQAGDEMGFDPQKGTSQSSIHGGIPFYINPDVFDFAPDPKVSNWQTTSCVCIVFGYGSPFLPMMRLEVGIIVDAPSELRDGRKLRVREAQLDSANAAEAAAGIIKGMLDSHTIGPSEVQPRFVGFMGGAIMSTGLGYRVRGCYPKCDK